MRPYRNPLRNEQPCNDSQQAQKRACKMIKLNSKERRQRKKVYADYNCDYDRHKLTAMDRIADSNGDEYSNSLCRKINVKPKPHPLPGPRIPFYALNR